MKIFLRLSKSVGHGSQGMNWISLHSISEAKDEGEEIEVVSEDKVTVEPITQQQAQEIVEENEEFNTPVDSEEESDEDDTILRETHVQAEF